MNQQQTTKQCSCDPQQYELYRALLPHPSVAQDQRVVASLLQASQQLQEAVAQLQLGQLQAALSTAKVQQAEALVCWLRKHARLLQGLDLQLISSIRHGGTLDWAGFAAAITAAVQEAAASGALAGLQSLALRGTTAGPAFLRALPAAQLTKLTVEVFDHDTSAMTALATCTALRSLHLQLRRLAPDSVEIIRLKTAELAAARSAVLQPLAAGLQQLTELRIGPVTGAQLRQLPTKLRQLHVMVDLGADAEQLRQLTSWMQQHASLVSSLQLAGFRHVYAFNAVSNEWEAEVNALGGACATAAAAAAAATTGHCANAVSCKGLQLQSLVLAGPDDGCVATQALLQQLPAHSLTQLQCLVARRSAEQLAAVCRLTGLRSLRLQDSRPRQTTFGDSDSALAPLTALQQLTELQLPSLHPPQLVALQQPQLQQLRIEICNSAENPPLQVAHLTSLHTLHVEDYSWCGLGGDIQLPPSLQDLSWICLGFCTRCKGCMLHGCSVQALLALTRLQKLYITFNGHAPTATELAQLSSLSSLQEVGLGYSQVPCNVLAASAAEAWPVLPLVRLDVDTTDETRSLVVEQLTLHASTVRHLTRLHCVGYSNATLYELAAVLQQLPDLQSLDWYEHGSSVDDKLQAFKGPASAGADIIKAHGMEAVVELLQTLGSLHELSSVRVCEAVRLTEYEGQQVMRQLQQLLGRQLSVFCTVDEHQPLPTPGGFYTRFTLPLHACLPFTWSLHGFYTV
jgi:hypothetical protein